MVIKPKHPEELKAFLSKRPLVLYGLGGLGKRIAAYCEAYEITITCFTDGNIQKLTDIRSLPPKDMAERFPMANVLISSAVHYKEIESEIIKLGYTPEQILSYQLFLPDEVTWNELEKNANWERMRKRVKQVAKWIDDEDKSVVDYGAGEMYMKLVLKPDVQYFPVDYIQRTSEMIVCDLNSGAFPNISADVIVLGAVLEFINTAESLIKHVCKTAKRKVIVACVVIDRFNDIPGRRASGYLNDYSEQDLKDIFDSEHFIFKEKEISAVHNIETVFLFERCMSYT